MEDSIKNRDLSFTPSKKLGEILVDMGLCTEEELNFASSRATNKKVRIGELLVSEGKITEQDLATAIAKQHGLELVDLNQHTPNPALSKLLPEKIARAHKLIPLESSNHILTLVTNDPIQLAKLGNFDHHSCMKAII